MWVKSVLPQSHFFPPGQRVGREGFTVELSVVCCEKFRLILRWMKQMVPIFRETSLTLKDAIIAESIVTPANKMFIGTRATVL